MYRHVQSMARVNGVELCFETFGDSGDPAILLVAGMASSMDCSSASDADRTLECGDSDQ